MTHPQREQFVHRPFALAESLEARRLLAATLDPDTRIVTITGTDGADVIQFQVDEPAGGTDAATSFSVLESVATGASPPLSFPTQQEILDFIASGGTPTATSFEIALVNEIRIASGAGDDLVILSRKLSLPVRMDGGAGNDSLSAGPGDDTLLGGDGNDYLFGGASDDFINGQAGADELLGGQGLDTTDFSNRLLGISLTLDNTANDGVLEGDNVRSDFEAVIGGQGHDMIDVSGAPGRMYVDGADGNDTIIGSDLADTIHGGAGANQISAGAGDDLVFAENSSTDTIDGGPGADMAFVDVQDGTLSNVESVFSDAPAAGDVEAVPGGSAAIVNRVLNITGTSGGDLVRLVLASDVLNVLVYETPDFAVGEAEPFISEFALADFNSISASLGDGDDIFHGGAIDKRSIIDGGAGNDILVAGPSDDLLIGSDGDDFLFGRGGHDTLRGGAGSDWMSGAAGNDTADYSDRASDVLVSVGWVADDGERGERDTVYVDIQTVMGGSGNDRLSTGASLNTTFIGGPGRDEMIGGTGNDTFFAADGEIDTIRGGPGDDVLGSADESDDVLL